MHHRYITADVFTTRPLEGNPLAVFPDARGVPSSLMQRIARELNLSETVFVLPPDDPRHTRRLRIFTPAAELPMPVIRRSVPPISLRRWGRFHSTATRHGSSSRRESDRCRS